MHEDALKRLAASIGLLTPFVSALQLRTVEDKHLYPKEWREPIIDVVGDVADAVAVLAGLVLHLGGDIPGMEKVKEAAAQESVVAKLTDILHQMKHDAADARKLAICVQCEEPAAPKCHTAAGRREYDISGLCEECFDALFASDA